MATRIMGASRSYSMATHTIVTSLWKWEEFHSECLSRLQRWHASVANVVWFSVQLQPCLLYHLQNMERVHTHIQWTHIIFTTYTYHKRAPNHRDRGEWGEWSWGRERRTARRRGRGRWDGEKEAEGEEACRYVHRYSMSEFCAWSISKQMGNRLGSYHAHIPLPTATRLLIQPLFSLQLKIGKNVRLLYDIYNK